MRVTRPNYLFLWLGAVLLSAAPSLLCAQKRTGQKVVQKRAPTAAASRAHTAAKPTASARKKKVAGRSSKTRRRERAQQAPTADRISEIQEALAREGAYQGEPTGQWDAATVEAMKRFEAAHGLNVDGKIDALSLQKLGLGSEVAGRAAPRPPVMPPASSSPNSK